MRRLIAYIIMAVCMVLGIGVSFTTVAKNVQGNMQYQSAYQYVYRLENFDGSEIDDNVEAAKDVADIMVKRLINSGVSEYVVSVEGNDTVSVTYAIPNDSKFDNSGSEEDEKNLYSYKIAQYLAADGNLSLTSQDCQATATKEDAFKDSVSSVVYLQDAYPTVIIPVDTANEKYTAVLDEAKALVDKESEEETKEGEQKTTSLLLWSNFDEDFDTYEKTISGNEQYDAKVAEKVVMTFDYNQLYYPDEQNNKLAAAMKVDVDGDEKVSRVEMSNATKKAQFLSNIFNAEQLDYEVTLLYRNDNPVPASIEPLVVLSNNSNIAMSTTFRATILVSVIIILGLILFYRLGSLAVVSLTASTAFATFALAIAVGLEFNIATLIGILIVTMISLFSGILYLSKIKEESYKGRTLKKANAEASRKSTWLTIDVSVISVIAGLFFFIFGGALLSPMGAVLMAGGVINVLINTIGLKIMMWLLCNTTNIQGKYGLFGIDGNKVPDVINNQKQFYEGPYEKKDFTKTKKPIGIIVSVLSACALVGLITFSSLNMGTFNGSGPSKGESKVYIELNDDGHTPILKYESDVSNVLENIYIVDDSNSNENKLDFTKVELNNRNYRNDEHLDHTYNYFVIYLNSYLTGEENARLKDSSGAIIVEESLNEVLDQAFHNADPNIEKVNLKVTTKLALEPNSYLIFIVASISISVMSVYVMVRFGIGKGLAALIGASASSLIAVGLISLCRIATTSIVSLAVVTTIMATFILALYLFGKQKELLSEERRQGIILDSNTRQKTMIKALTYSMVPSLVLTFIMAFTYVVCFGFGPQAFAILFIASIIGLVLSLLFVAVLLGPLSVLFDRLVFKLTNKISTPKKRKNAKKKKIVQRSAEPEEAVFIGIND